jgi:hypothetical protein
MCVFLKTEKGLKLMKVAKLCLQVTRDWPGGIEKSGVRHTGAGSFLP